jgi:hypothetical protein
MSGRHLSLFPGHTLRSSLSPSSSSTLYYFRFEAGGGEGYMNRVENHTVQKPKCQEGAILFIHKRDKKRLLTSPPYRQKMKKQVGD